MSEEKISNYTLLRKSSSIGNLRAQIHKSPPNNTPNKAKEMAKLTDLPTELIVQILSNLEYMTLNLNVRRVCRLFDETITTCTSGPLGEALFRSKYKGDVPYPAPSTATIPKGYNAGIEGEDMIHDKGYYYQLHPIIPFLVLEHLIAINTPALTGCGSTTVSTRRLTFQDVLIVRGGITRRTPLHSTKMADEQALSRPIPPKLFYDLESKYKSRDMNWFSNIPRVFLRSSQSSNKNITVKEFITLLLRDYQPALARRFQLIDHEGRLVRLSLMFRGLEVSLAIMWLRKGAVSQRREYRYSVTTVLRDFEQESTLESAPENTTNIQEGNVGDIERGNEDGEEDHKKEKEEMDRQETEKLYTTWFIDRCHE